MEIVEKILDYLKNRKEFTGNEVMKVTYGDCIDSIKEIVKKESELKNNGWTKIESDNDFPKIETKLITYNGIKTNINPIGRKTMWSLYKKGLITHYQPVLKPQDPLY